MALELGLLLLSLLMLGAILASKASVKLGIPALLLFIGIGMLAGSDGPGGLDFTDTTFTKNVGLVGLALILFSGGLDSKWEVIRPVIWRGLSLATIGVVVTAGLVAAFAHFAFGFEWVHALLLGAVVSSTDAAAIFGVLRGRSVKLKHKLGPLLELESGSNDPVAVFLTIALTGLAMNPDASPWSLIPRLILELPIGAAVGAISAYGALWLINHLRLEYDGLYSVLTLSTVLFVFGAAHLVGGNGFLGVYVAGVVMGSSNFLHKIALTQFHEALAWLMQIAMFILLGLLVFPSQVVAVAIPGLALSAFLILVARPIAVYISLARAHMTKRSKFFVAWAGLRGAVPIILATFPLIAGTSRAQEIFNLVFFVVLSSVLIQGTALGWMAKLLSVRAPVVPPDPAMRSASGELLEIEITEGSHAADLQVVELGLPSTALIVLLTRDGESYIPRGATVLRPGDIVMVATRREDHDELRHRILGN